MKRKTIINFLALLVCSIGYSSYAQMPTCDPLENPCEQNLICFGTFEEFTTDAEFQAAVSDFDFPGQSNQTADLIRLNGSGQYERDGSTGLYPTACGYSAYPNAVSGTTYGGMSYWSSTNRREGIALPLNTPLEAGKSYDLEFYAQVAGPAGNATCDVNIEIYVSENMPCPAVNGDDWDDCAEGFGIVVTENFTVTNHTSWQFVTVSFTVPVGSNDLHAVTFTSNNAGGRSYVYLDDVAIIADDCHFVEDDEVTICEGDQIQLNVQTTGYTNPTYSWNTTTGFTGCTNCPNPTVSPSQTIDYVVTVTEGSSSETGTIRVNVVEDPDVFAGFNQHVCENSEVTLSGSYTMQGGEVLEWLSEFNSVLGTGISYTYTTGQFTPSSQTFKFKVTKGECSWTDEVVVNTYNNPYANAGSDISICEGETVDLSGSAGGFGGFYYYNWTTTGAQNFNGFTNQQNVNVGPLYTSQTYKYTVTKGETVNCSSSDEITITVLTDPNITIIGDQDVCDGAQVNLTANYTVQGRETLEWLDGSGNVIGSGASYSFTAETTLPKTETYSFRVTIGSCSWIESIDINSYPNPVIELVDLITICKGESIDLSGVVSPAGSYTYAWTTTGTQNFNGSTSSANTNVGPLTANQTYRLTVTSTEPGQCEGYAEVTVAVIPDDNLVFNGTLEWGLTPTSRSSLGSSDNWINATGDPDLFDYAYANCVGSPLPQACGATTNDYNCMDIPCNHFGYLKHRNGDNGRYAGLWSSSSSELGDFDGLLSILEPLIGGLDLGILDFSAEGVKTIVEGMEIPLPDNLDPDITYEMSFYVSKAPKGMSNRLMIDDKAHFLVKMSTSAVTSTIPFNPTPAPEIHRGSTDVVGSWEKISFTFKPKAAYNHIIIESTYPVNVVDRLEVSGSELSEFTNAPAFDGIESYMYVDDIEIRQYCSPQPDPLVVDAGVDRTYCVASGCQQFMIGGAPAVTGGVAPYTYQWTPSVGLSDPTIANPTVCSTNNQTYTLTVTDANGVQASDQMIHTANTPPVANAGADLYLCPGSCAQIGASAVSSGGTAPYSYAWSNGSNLERPTVCAGVEGTETTYSVTVTDANGCVSNTDEVVVISDRSSSANIVVNGSMEDFTSYSDFTSTASRFNFPGQSEQSSDLIRDKTRIQNRTGYSTSCGYTAFPDAFVGRSYAGMSFRPNWYGTGQHRREGFTLPFASPLQPGQSYTLRFAARASGPQGNSNCDVTAQIILSEQMPCPTNTGDWDDCSNGFTQVLTYTQLVDNHDNWELVTINFTVPSGSNPLNAVVFSTLSADQTSYLLIDEVTIPGEECGFLVEDEVLTICEGDQVQLNVQTDGFTNPNYSWSPAVSGCSNCANPTVSPTQTTVYAVTVSEGGSSAIGTITVNVIPDDNLVPNEGLSAGTLPDGRSQLDRATGWFNATGDPDLFDSDYQNCLPAPIPSQQACNATGVDYNCLDIPCNHFGYMYHRGTTEGRYAGLYQAAGSGFDIIQINIDNAPVETIPGVDAQSIVEGMEIELTKALEEGKRYNLSMYVSMAPKGLSEKFMVDVSASFLVKMSKGASISTVPLTPTNAPVILAGETYAMNSWEHITYSFVAEESYDHLIIESTYSKDIGDRLFALSERPNVGFERNGLETYMYIDDISLVEDCPGAQSRTVSDESDIEETKLESIVNIMVFPNPTQGALTLQYQDLVSLRSQLVIVDASGNVVMKNALGSGTGSMSIDISDLPEGIYFYHVTDMNNELIKRDKIVLIK